VHMQAQRIATKLDGNIGEAFLTSGRNGAEGHPEPSWINYLLHKVS
jgi:hypothetical protein